MNTQDHSKNRTECGSDAAPQKEALSQGAPAPLNRRRFLVQATHGVGFLALGSLVSGGWTTPGNAAVNRFAYDVERFSTTDPKFLVYDRAGGLPIPDPAPRRIVFSKEGQLYVAGKRGINVLDRSGGLIRLIEAGAPVRCVAVDGNGQVYAGVRDHVEVFDPAGRRVRRWEAPSKKAWLTGLAVSNADVFLADSGSRLIWRCDLEGKIIGKIGEKNPERNVPGLILPSPYLDVKVGGDGLLRVNNSGRHRIEVYTADGDLELFWGKPSAAIEGFCGCCNPVGLALLADGRHITCEKGLPRVKRYAADGTFEGVVAGPESFPKNAQAGKARDSEDGTMGGLDAAVDARGWVYVLDLVVAEVQVYQPKGAV